MSRTEISAVSAKFRALVPDLRGFGASTTTSGTVTMEDFADDLHGLLHAAFVDKPVVFCGLSMGGYVGWQFFRKYRAQLKAFILCDTRASADTPEAVAGRHKLAQAVLKEGPQAALDAMLPRLVSATTAERNPTVITELRSMILQNKPAGIAAALEGMAARPDCTELLPQIDVPTLVICGKEDQITPAAEMQTLAQAIPGAQFVEIPGAGHMSPMENPDAVNGAITRFLAGLRW